MSNVLYEPFNIEKHKATFVNYLEICISTDGIIQYAIPSHQEFLIKMAMKNNNWTRDELMDACPKEYYCDFLKWLIPQSGGWIPVWENFVLHYEPLTKSQINSLRKLKIHGLFNGKIIQGELRNE